MEDATSGLTINILDASGAVVRSMNLGAQNSGAVNFSWDGLDDMGERLSAGDYTIEAIALTGGESIQLGTLLAEKVESVTLGSAGVTLDLASDRSVPISGIKQVM